MIFRRYILSASLVLAAVLFGPLESLAQKFGYIDSQFILSKMPAYTDVQKEVDKLSENWQKEIEGMYAEIDKLKKNYQAEEVLLTEEMKKERLAAIAEKEKAAKDYQKKIFGFEGLAFKKRQDLMKVVQDEVFEATQKVAKAKALQFIFDKSADLVMIYTDPRHDYTDYVLEELGLAPQTPKTGTKPAEEGGVGEDTNPGPPGGRRNDAPAGIKGETKTPPRSNTPSRGTQSKPK